MPFCEQCGEEIGYLPFRCKYCGSTFCKKHRLPENHDCTFELKHTPVTPTTPRESRPRYQDVSPRRPTSDYKREKEIRKYLKQQRKQSRQATRGYQSNLGGVGETNGTTFLMIMIVIFSISAFIFTIVGYPFYINFSVYGLSNLFLWIIFTALFISYSSELFGLFFLFILIIFLYNIAKTIEQRFGTKFLISLYIFCAIFTGLFYILIRFLLVLINYPINRENGMYIGLATGAIIGLIAFIVYHAPRNEMTMLCFFLPVRMKGRVLLLILILFRLIPGLLFGLLMSPTYFALYLPDLGGILASYIVFKIKSKRGLPSSYS